MRRSDFPGEVKKATLTRANFRCERCWRSNGLEFHHKIPIAMGGDYSLDNCIVLCHECHRLAPSDPFLLKHLFLRFASVKEMIRHYKSNSEQEAFEKWKVETGFIGKDNSNTHSALVKRRMEEKAKKGTYLGFGHPYGYDYRDSKLMINEIEAPIVKKIYDLYIEGWGLGKIANYLKKNKCSTKRGGIWDKRKVSNILKNPVYCGLVDWDGIIKQGKHEAIINKNTFLKAQKAFGSRSGEPYRAARLVDKLIFGSPNVK